MKYKNNHYRWRIPMMNLQLFAEGEGDGSGAGDGNEDGAGAGAGDNGNELSFDDFLKEGDNQAEYDRRIQKAVNAAVTRAQEKWKALTDDKLSEAEKLAKMTKEEKAEYKRAGRSEATECCYGNGKDSQKDVGRRRDQHS